MPPLATLKNDVLQYEEMNGDDSSNSFTEMLFDMFLVGGCAPTSYGKKAKRRNSIPEISMEISQILPMELKEPRMSKSGDRFQESCRPILSRSIYVRSKLAEWLPFSLKFNKLDMLYSSNHDGRCLESLYNKVGSAQHTIMLLEPMDNGSVVGLYASHPWHKSSTAYGNGCSFLFRIDEETHKMTQCWHWQRRDYALVEDDENAIAATCLYDQFQVSTQDFLSMGGNEDGCCGLRLNKDLTIAESEPAAGFGNMPLAGNLFEVGLVEVYEITSF